MIIYRSKLQLVVVWKYKCKWSENLGATCNLSQKKIDIRFYEKGLGWKTMSQWLTKSWPGFTYKKKKVTGF